jgi:cytochrome c553
MPDECTTSNRREAPMLLHRYRSFWLTLLLAAGACQVSTTHADSTEIPDTLEQRIIPCTVCHGKQGEGLEKAGYYFPRIGGKPAGYLYRQLLNFRAKRRQYVEMNYIPAATFWALPTRTKGWPADSFRSLRSSPTCASRGEIARARCRSGRRRRREGCRQTKERRRRASCRAPRAPGTKRSQCNRTHIQSVSSTPTPMVVW